MNSITRNKAGLGTALAAVLALGTALGAPSQAQAQAPVAVTPAETINLSVGRGSMVRLDAPMSDLFVADSNVADVQVRSSNQLYLYGKAKGETTVYATDRNGRVVYSANIRVGNNLSTLDDLLRVAMPDAEIEATPMNGLVLLTGTVKAPADVEEASRIVQAFVGEQTQIVSRLRTATPLQVNLQVKIAEVNRSLVREIGANLLTRDTTGGFLFGIGRGRSVGTITDVTSPTLTDPVTGLPRVIGTRFNPTNVAGPTTSINLAGRLFGLDILSALDLFENDGLVTTLANPNLTALSGETASFLAGGEFPIPISQSLGQITIEYKQYGVSLAFTPYVLADGRISMRVRPEVSELSNEGSIRLNGFNIPALTTRRAETTVELGSGQSFMIGGLLRNANTNTVDKAPFLGDIPILGALFRSQSFRRSETELVIVVTPYLVKPVSANQIALPTDGYRAATPLGQVFAGQSASGQSGARRPVPVAARPRVVQPGVTSAPSAGAPRTTAAPAPGFKL